MHLNDYKFSIQTQELNCLFNFFKFCAIKYIWKSLIHGYFFLEEFHSEIVHNSVISRQTVEHICSVMVSVLASSAIYCEFKHEMKPKNLKIGICWFSTNISM